MYFTCDMDRTVAWFEEVLGWYSEIDERLREYVLAKGWTQVSEVTVQPWGGKTLDITTVDGCILSIFE